MEVKRIELVVSKHFDNVTCQAILSINCGKQQLRYYEHEKYKLSHFITSPTYFHDIFKADLRKSGFAQFLEIETCLQDP